MLVGAVAIIIAIEKILLWIALKGWVVLLYCS